MLFDSVVFFIFAAIFFALWPILKRGRRRRWIGLTCFSFFFYGWWDWRFVGLLLASGLIDYWAALGIERIPARRKAFLIASILGNVGSLALFKYLGFLTWNLHALAETLGTGLEVPLVSLTLPAGISFYTFQSMSYTIDVYRGKLRATDEVFHFFAYLSLFPQLVAGPIVRAKVLLPQLEEEPQPSREQWWEGLRLLVHGYFKKVVLADQLAPVVNHAFQQPEVAQSCPYWWIVITMFAFQIYCDFSGYSDIALGLGKWMGYEFPVNFNHPFVATSFKEFWARWQISLSSWFRDYLYIPLGGSRNGPVAAARNMWITMLLFGLWHGAAWTFVVCGAVLAAFMTIERATGWPEKLTARRIGRPVATLLLLGQIWIAWTLFRATSLSQATSIIAVLLNPTLFDLAPLGLLWNQALAYLVLAVAVEIGVYIGVPRWRIVRSRPALALEPLFLAALIAICVLFRGPGSAFIYFQF